MKLRANLIDFPKDGLTQKNQYVTRNLDPIEIYNFCLSRISVRWILVFTEMQQSQCLSVHSATAVVWVALLQGVVSAVRGHPGRRGMKNHKECLYEIIGLLFINIL
jgi:hypothetical protein